VISRCPASAAPTSPSERCSGSPKAGARPLGSDSSSSRRRIVSAPTRTTSAGKASTFSSHARARSCSANQNASTHSPKAETKSSRSGMASIRRRYRSARLGPAGQHLRAGGEQHGAEGPHAEVEARPQPGLEAAAAVGEEMVAADPADAAPPVGTGGGPGADGDRRRRARRAATAAIEPLRGLVQRPGRDPEGEEQRRRGEGPAVAAPVPTRPVGEPQAGGDDAAQALAVVSKRPVPPAPRKATVVPHQGRKLTASSPMPPPTISQSRADLASGAAPFPSPTSPE